jgi:hypothetical protein
METRPAFSAMSPDERRAWIKRAWDEARADRDRRRAEMTDARTRMAALCAAVPMPPIRFFEDLRDLIVREQGTRPRWPKWYWRLAPDLALELQAQDRQRYLFAGDVLAGPQVTRATFRLSRSARPRDLGSLEFVILDAYGDGSAWQFKATGFGHPVERAEALRTEVLGRLTPDVFRHVDAVDLLVPQCLICGRALTDPISQARWIGPECAGKQRSLPPSLEPRVARLEQQAQHEIDLDCR